MHMFFVLVVLVLFFGTLVLNSNFSKEANLAIYEILIRTRFTKLL